MKNYLYIALAAGALDRGARLAGTATPLRPAIVRRATTASCARRVTRSS